MVSGTGRRARKLGFDTYLPHRDTGIKDTREEIFQSDLRGLKSAELVIAVLNGPDVDSGAAWELGHAYARGIPIVGIHEDIRLSDAAAQMNLMVYHAAQVVCASLEELSEYLLQIREAKEQRK